MGLKEHAKRIPAYEDKFPLFLASQRLFNKLAVKYYLRGAVVMVIGAQICTNEMLVSYILYNLKQASFSKTKQPISQRSFPC